MGTFVDQALVERFHFGEEGLDHVALIEAASQRAHRAGVQLTLHGSLIARGAAERDLGAHAFKPATRLGARISRGGAAAEAEVSTCATPQ